MIEITSFRTTDDLTKVLFFLFFVCVCCTKLGKKKINKIKKNKPIEEWSEPIDLLVFLEELSPGGMDSNIAAVINRDHSLIGMVRDAMNQQYLVTADNFKDNTTYKVHNPQSVGLFPQIHNICVTFFVFIFFLLQFFICEINECLVNKQTKKQTNKHKVWDRRYVFMD